MIPAFIDFETRSIVDLKKRGLDNYSNHHSTDVLCVGFTFGDEEVQLWKMGDPIPRDLLMHVEEGRPVIAHNANFEIQIWNNIITKRYGWPPLKIEQVTCTMSMCLAMSLPASLENAAIALNLKEEKDKAGSRVMLKLSRPRDIEGEKVTWWDKEEFSDLYEKLYSYCKQDVNVERQIFKTTAPLHKSEKKLWELDYKINQRGILVDIKSVVTAIKLIEAEKERLDSEMKRVTKGEVESCSANAQLTKWLVSRGVDALGVAKSNIEFLLNSYIPLDCRDALLLRREAAKSSTAKLATMFNLAGKDGRLRNTTQFHGAGTGRWAGRGVQVHNLPKPSVEQEVIDTIFALMEAV